MCDPDAGEVGHGAFDKRGVDKISNPAPRGLPGGEDGGRSTASPFGSPFVEWSEMPYRESDSYDIFAARYAIMELCEGWNIYFCYEGSRSLYAGGFVSCGKACPVDGETTI